MGSPWIQASSSKSIFDQNFSGEFHVCIVKQSAALTKFSNHPPTKNMNMDV